MTVLRPVYFLTIFLRINFLISYLDSNRLTEHLRLTHTESFAEWQKAGAGCTSRAFKHPGHDVTAPDVWPSILTDYTYDSELDNADGVPLASRRSSMFPEGNYIYKIIRVFKSFLFFIFVMLYFFLKCTRDTRLMNKYIFLAAIFLHIWWLIPWGGTVWDTMTTWCFTQNYLSHKTKEYHQQKCNWFEWLTAEQLLYALKYKRHCHLRVDVVNKQPVIEILILKLLRMIVFKIW